MLRRQQHHHGALAVASVTSWSLSYSSLRRADHPRAISAPSSCFPFLSRSIFPGKERFTLLSEISTPSFCSTRWCSARGAFTASSVNSAPSSTSSSTSSSGSSQNHEQEGFRRILEKENLIERIQRHIDDLEKKRLNEVVVVVSIIDEIAVEESNNSVTLEDVEQIAVSELLQSNSPARRLLLLLSSQHQQQQKHKGDSSRPSILYKLLQEPAIVELGRSLQRERYLLEALQSVSITTVFDWVRRSDAEKADAVSDAAARARLDSMCMSFLEKAYISQITTDSIKSLLPGSSHRHASVSGHNMKGRTALTGELSTVLEGFAIGSRDKLPLIILISMPRQGKTLFLDNIGYDRAILEAFVNKSCAESTTAPCLIFNLTFNAMWPSPASCSLEEAKQQVCVRLLASALGRFGPCTTDMLDLLRKLASLHHNNISAVADFVVSCVSSALHSSSIGHHPSRQHCVFLFDEITLLSDAIYRFYKENKQYSQQQVDDHVQEFNSCLSALIGQDRAVILSGFNHMQSKLTGSGRPVWPVHLTPATAAQQRRQLHCMKTNFFQRLSLLSDLPKGRSGGSDHPIHKAVAVYEFVKSSPGVFGAVLERLASVESANDFIYSVSGIPFMKKRMSSGSYGDCFIDVLALKAVQYMSILFDNRSSFSKRASDTLGRAENLSLIQLPIRTPGSETDASLQSEGTIEDLQSSRLEPLFVSGPRLKAKDVSLLLFRFYTMITCFAEGFVAAEPVKANADLIEASSLADSRIDDRFGLFDDEDGGVLQGNNITSPATSTALSKKAMSGTVFTRTAMLESAANFFEDSVLMGILLQREFRSRAAVIAISAEGGDLSTMRSFTTTLEDWLPDAFAIDSSSTHAQLRIQWSVIQLPVERDIQHLKAASLQLLSSVVQFSGHYPSLPLVKDNHSSKHSHACASVNWDEHFNVETILVPRRPENNPIADIIFHEKTIDGELVQFWIDTKHRSQRHDTHLSGTTIARGVESVPTHIVKHVVHIIISPQEIRTSGDFKQVLGERSNFNQCSYSLFRVNPDDMTHSKAFENLVSQPVALSIPLIEQQLNDSWTRSLPLVNGWSKYKSTRLDSSLLRFLSTEEFTELRSLAFADDCSSLIVNELNDTSEAAREMWQLDRSRRRLLGLPFACMLEAFRLLPRRWNGDCYAIDLRTRRIPALVLSGVAQRSQPSSMLMGNNNNSNNNHSSIRDDLMIELVDVHSKGTLSIELSKILRHIKVGHVARFGHKTKQMETSFEYNEQQTMTDLWCRVHEAFTTAAAAAALPSSSSSSPSTPLTPSIASYLTGDVGMIWSMSLYRVLSFLCVHQNLRVAFGSNVAINTLVQVFGEEKLRKFADDELAKAEKQNAADFENDMRQDKALNKLAKSKKEPNMNSALKELRREKHPELVANALSILKEEIEAAFEKIVEELKLR